MKIYTRTGDGGETSLFGGKRVGKDSLRIQSYGTVDELNASLGYADSISNQSDIKKVIEQLQNDLFSVGADLATPTSAKSSTVIRIDSTYYERLEEIIDKYDAELEPLMNFILPGGVPSAAQLHIARTICRRAEREVVSLSKKDDVNKEIIIYLNRLSDLLFVLARVVNARSERTEKIWKGREKKTM